MTRDDLFNTNASIVRDLVAAIASHAPKSHILIISNPVNSTVPIAREVLKQHGVYDPRRVFGVTTLDVVRASRFVSELKGTRPEDTHVTVVGGHSGVTIVPLLSQSGHSFTDDERAALTNRIQFGGDEVVKAKDGAGSATLSMAYAGARFANSVLEATVGAKSGIIEPTFVESPLFQSEGIDFFSTNVLLGPNGVEKIHPLGKISAYEQDLIDAAKKDLKGNIKKGVEFASK